MSSKLTDLTELTTPTSDDLLYAVDDPAGTPASKKLVVDNLDTYLSASTKTLTNKTISSASNTITVTASNVSDFDTEVANNSAVTANTAKVTNATHSGDASGDTTLTLNATAISGKSTNAGLAGTEEVLINNAGTLEKTTTQDIADLGGGGADPIWEATVGSTGADYTDIASAITAGKTRILLITSITDSNAITLPDNLHVRGLTGVEVWTHSSSTNLLTGTAGHTYTFEKFGISVAGDNANGFVNNLAYTLKLIDVNIDISNTLSSRQFFGANGSNLTLYMRGGSITIDNRNGWYHQASVGEATYVNVKFIGTTSSASFGLFGDNMKSSNLHIMGTWDNSVRGDYQGTHSNWRVESAIGGNLYEGVYTGFNIQATSCNFTIIDTDVQLVNWNATSSNITGSSRNGFKLSGSNIGTVNVSGSDHNYSGTYFQGTLTVSQNEAVISGCTFNTTCTVSGSFNSISACDFQGSIVISGKGNTVSACNFVSLPTVSGAGNTITGAKSTTLRTKLINRKSEFVVNNSGTTMAVGDIVVVDSDANADRITTTTTAGDSKVYGMVEESIGNGSGGWVLIEGYTTALKVDGTADIAIGDYIMTFTTAGIGQLHTTGNTYIAQAFEAYITDDSNGVINAFIGKGYA